MFEKEAEEWFEQSEFKGTCSMGSESFRLSAISIWQKGAEFGYNKAMEQLTEAKEILRDLIKFQPYIDKEAMFLSIGNEWKTVIYKAEQFLNSEVEK